MISPLTRLTRPARLTQRAALLSAVLTITVALSGCGGDATTATSSATTAAPGEPSASAPASFDEADVLFTQMMIPHHRDALTMTELAETQSRDREVRELAQQIRSTQQSQLETMVGWVQSVGKPTTAPKGESDHGPGEHAVPGAMTFGAMVRLREASGPRFDSRFLTGMIRHHRGTIATARAESARGSSPEVTALAEELIASQQAQITTMKKILARL